MMNRIPFNKPSMVGCEFSFLEEALERGQLSGDGYFTKRCNERIVKLSGSPAALLTHSCTAALEMAGILCDLKPGDEVIMPSFTFVSTANAVVLRGATPVFVDIDQHSLNIDPNQIEAAITPQTRAIFAVHYAGFPAEMDRLNQIAQAHGLMVIEDAAQALGSTYKGRPAGSLGDIAAFSFHETKNIISGEGGAITVNRRDLVERAEIIREKGTNRSRFLRGQVDRYTWVDIGSSFLPGELVAAFLFAQLEQEEVIRQARLALFGRYQNAFADLAQQERVVLPWHSDDVTGNGHMFYLLMRDIDDRDALIGHLREAGIIAPLHYVPLHSAPGGRRFGRAEGDLSVTDNTYSRLIRLPLYLTLGDEIERVIDVTRSWLSANA
ncbi:dTDP-4-amino-4,6-dideoxygalactose transaminase [Paracoccus benzoatiresistens]|uniref:dTDP-4-amino-4,6-dideoxygalactose transaminase n=1 Tax=Paracoccus benzoatiresistens TaxID=2997341 RepID=A0ABT4JBA1_9RHOB|nr:dTDP-4-amino-4,6-dideoxygalactose transaminase [Paracoccus sp. EF6]MCZ0964381.1 dTDP-4-amino-4,6-dideoxygalactose transaminase [Paracoccus sp. EF6]